MATHLAFWMPGLLETMVLLVVGLVLFGGNLPEVGKSVGRSLIEFRKGLKDLKTSSGLDEVTKVKDEILGMAREVDPRRMMDVDDAHLPDDPYADVYQEGEFNEVESSKPDSDTEAPEVPASTTMGPDPIVADDDGGIGEADDAPPKHEDSGRLEGSHREPHEEDDPPPFGYDRHG